MAAVRPLHSDLYQLRQRMRAATLRDEVDTIRELIARVSQIEPKLLRAQARAEE